MTRRHAIVMFLALFVFVAFIKTPPMRVVVQDGLDAICLGELLKREWPGSEKHEQHAPENARVNVSERLKKLGSIRQEWVPLSIDEAVKMERTVTFDANVCSPGLPDLPDNRLSQQRYSLAIVYAVLYYCDAGQFYVFGVMVPLLIIVAALIARFSAVVDVRVLWLVFLFNPLFLFYSYHHVSLDWINVVFISIYVGLLFLWRNEIEGAGTEWDRGKAIFFGVCFSLLSLFLIMGDPFNLMIIAVSLVLMLSSCGHPLKVVRLSAWANVIGPVVVVFLFGAVVLPEGPWPFLLGHPLTRPLGVFRVDHAAGPWSSMVPILITNCYLLCRAAILGLPLIIPAIAGFVVLYGKDRLMCRALLAMMVLKVMPVLVIRDLEFSHYLITGRALLPLLPLLAVPAALWLSQRTAGEKIAFVAAIVLIGCAGYFFFLARMRIDIFDCGLLSALDKNFTRMYLVFQRLDYF